MKKILILIILNFLIFQLIGENRDSLFKNYKSDSIPIWSFEVDVSSDSNEEYLVAYAYSSDIAQLEINPEYKLWTDRVVLFQFQENNYVSTEIDYYGLPLEELEGITFNNDKINLGEFNNFFFIYDLNGNGINEILIPVNGGGEDTYFQILEYNSISKSFDILLNQLIDPYFNYPIQTISIDGKLHLKIFPWYGNRTRKKIQNGKYQQKYLIFDWDEDKRRYSEIESGYDYIYQTELHW